MFLQRAFAPIKRLIEEKKNGLVLSRFQGYRRTDERLLDVYTGTCIDKSYRVGGATCYTTQSRATSLSSCTVAPTRTGMLSHTAIYNTQGGFAVASWRPLAAPPHIPAMVEDLGKSRPTVRRYFQEMHVSTTRPFQIASVFLRLIVS